MGLPSGLLWSPVNIDESQPGGFAESPYMYEASFFSWGNVDSHKPTSPSSFSPWDWGGVNAGTPYYDGQVYGSTPGALLTTDIPSANDIASRMFGAGWRIPSSTDFEELIANCDFIDANGVVIEGTDKRVVVNGIVGIRLKSRVNGAVLFMAACGFANRTSWINHGSAGYYWSVTWLSERNALCLLFNTDNILEDNPQARNTGCTIRPVFDPNAV